MLTQLVRVSTTTQYLGVEERGAHFQHAFSYTISIVNDSDHSVQLISRHWNVTDSQNNEQNISGAGVVGQQPIIAPGDSFQYTSWALIDTDTGTMSGHYIFQDIQECSEFEVAIPAFQLQRPKGN